MRVKFWGTRGSLPAPLGASAVRDKVKAAIQAALDAKLKPGQDIEQFIEDKLPFSVSSSYGGNTSCV